MLELAPNDTVTISVTRAGYVAQNVSVSGTDDNHNIVLAPVGGGPTPKPPPSATTRPTVTQPTGMGLGPDPFANPPSPKK